MMFIFVLAKNVLLCHFILFVFPPQKSCNYCTSQTVDSIIENGRGGGHWGVLETGKTEEKIIQNRKNIRPKPKTAYRQSENR